MKSPKSLLQLLLLYIVHAEWKASSSSSSNIEHAEPGIFRHDRLLSLDSDDKRNEQINPLGILLLKNINIEISINKEHSKGEKDIARDECFKKYGKRSSRHKNLRLPPILYTFQGSGNTWCRLLIEWATGVLTGSFHADKQLIPILPGESKCDWTVAVLKAHPSAHSFQSLYQGTYKSTRCKQNDITMQRAILLIRNPFDAIWSEYQRVFTRSHVQGIVREKFLVSGWHKDALRKTEWYRKLWLEEYNGIFTHLKPENILIIRYEDLKDTHTRIAVLRLITNFLKLNEEPESTERLQCAFQMADVEKVHRAVNQSEYMSKEEVYTEEIVCKMWRNLAAVSIPIGYRIWGNFSCE